jgi:hypothetical protein
METRTVIERIQISIWCRLIRYSDGTVVIWQGADRVKLDPYEAARIGLNNHQEQNRERMTPLEKGKKQ